MKVFGKIVIITVLCFCIFGFKGEVYADELEPQEDIGEVTYTFECLRAYSEMYKPAGYWATQWSIGTVTVSGYKLCIYQVVNSNGCVDNYVLFFNDYGYSTNCAYTSEGTTETGLYNGGDWYENSNNPHNITSGLKLYTCFSYYETSGFSFLLTNIPVFSSEEMAVGYINGSVSISQAENYEDCINISYDSTDIPIPHNLKVTEENSKYFISWSQTAEELPFITEVSYRRHIDALQITHDVEGAYPTYPNKPELFYNPLLLHKYDITDEILNIVKFYREKCGVDSFKCSYVIRIRNKYVKSESEIVYSNVVRAVLTISYDVNIGIKINAEYEEKNENGDFVPDSSYNDYGDGSGMIRDDIGAASGSSVSVGNFISNIVNGFGLLGDNGVISMMSSVFSFLPAELWALIYMMVSLFLIVALFKLVVK